MLAPRFILGDLDLTEYPYAIEFGSDLGAPENASEIIASLLQDGELVSSNRSSNREIALTVSIADSDLAGLASAERALALECDKQRNTLEVDPGDGFAPATVFETFRAQLQFARDDDEEIGGVRRYALTIPALPFGRSPDLETIAATAVGSTVRQSIREFAVKGSVRAPGSLAISHPTAALGEVLVWMGKDYGDDYRPNMMQYYFAQSDQYEVDATSVSGFTTQYGASGAGTPNNSNFRAPASQFQPGSYLAVLKGRGFNGSGTSGLTAKLANGPTGFAYYGDVAELPQYRLSGDGIFVLGVIELPPTRVPAETDAYLHFELEFVHDADEGSRVEELWLFRVDDQATLLRVDCGTGTAAPVSGPYNRLWVDVPSVDQPRGGVWVGTEVDRGDARHPGSDLIAKATPQFVPPTTRLFVITTGTGGAACELAYYPHSHTHNSGE